MNFWEVSLPESSKGHSIWPTRQRRAVWPVVAVKEDLPQTSPAQQSTMCENR